MQQTQYIEDLQVKQMQEFFKAVNEETLTKAMDDRLFDLIKEDHEFVRRVELTERQYDKAVKENDRKL